MDIHSVGVSSRVLFVICHLYISLLPPFMSSRSMSMFRNLFNRARAKTRQWRDQNISVNHGVEDRIRHTEAPTPLNDDIEQADEFYSDYMEMGGVTGVKELHEMDTAALSFASNVQDTSSPLKNTGFRKNFWAFRVMAMPYFHEKPTARVLFGVMILLTLLNSAVRVVFSYLARDFWTALAEGKVDEFYKVMRNFLLAMLILAPINVLYRFQRQKLAIHWREWMTNRVWQLYSSNRVYYGLERSTDRDTNIDNPDQRIAEDVRSFTEFSLALFLTVLMSLIDLFCFSVILFLIMPQLFLAIALFASFGTIVTILIGKILVRLNFEKLKKEANFRFSLVRIRENAESIAFLSGEQVEGKEVNHRFALVIANMHSINAALRNLDFFTTYYTYITWILPILVVAPEYFAGIVELGVVQQAAASFSHVLDDLSILVTQWESLSEFSAGIDRLFSFLNAIQQLDPDRSADSPLLSMPRMHHSESSYRKQTQQQQQQQHDEGTETIILHRFSRVSDDTSPILLINNLMLVTPDRYKRILFQNLNLSLRAGEHLLIVGPSGVGKSSLLRAIAGLWTAGSGSIQRPSGDDVYFLPQKPYCSLGSLRDQLLYPTITSDMSEAGGQGDDHVHNAKKSLMDEDLLEILQKVDLAELPTRVGQGDPIQGLNAVMDWSNVLSLGEQQRLSFGRILVNRPSLVVLDESTSALDVEAETRMYSLLKDLAARQNRDDSDPLCPALTYVSVGHRPTLLAHHKNKLVLNKAGCFVQPIKLSPMKPS